MVRQKKTENSKKSNGANLGFEATLWAAADKQRGHRDAAEYNHVVLGLIFLKYISDAFKEKHAAPLSGSATHERTGRAVCRECEVRKSDSGEYEEVGIWQIRSKSEKR